MALAPVKTDTAMAQPMIRPLQNGDRLSPADFKHLYALHPHIRKAELVEGVVYLASAVYFPHARAQAAVIAWLATYHSQTPKTQVTGEQSTELDADNEVQPDALLWLEGDVKLLATLTLGLQSAAHAAFVSRPAAA